MTAGLLCFARVEHRLRNNTCARARCRCPYLSRCHTVHFIVLLTAHKASCSLNPVCFLSLLRIQISLSWPKPKKLALMSQPYFCHILWLCRCVLFQCKLGSLMVEIGQILHMKITSSTFDLRLYHLCVSVCDR